MNKYVIHVLNVCMLTVLNIAFIKAQTSALQPLTAPASLTASGSRVVFPGAAKPWM